MANKCFMEFYYSVDKEIYDLFVVQKEYEKNNGNILKYRGKMFCPECKKAELSFTHKTSNKRAFLSKKPSSKHIDGCSLIHNYATNREVKQYIKKLSGEKIDDMLESALNLLLPKEEGTSFSATTHTKENPLVIQSKGKNGKQITKTIPKKSLNRLSNQIEEGKVFIFYGHVKLYVVSIDTKDGICYKLNLKVKKGNEWKWVASIFRYRNEDQVDENKVYDLAVLGHIEFYKGYPQIRTKNFSDIKWREITQ
ncbi:Uncharacterised protein [Mycoplasmopsis californica]|uniref:Transposase n=1 Tax=Mycoplasmopsis equigenitalium TaxID=114883 RepID=A0ABY5J288_9BACT|nr:hypothetical protein [Mycoplasmopsis equigenitalium]UUD37110.1 hypothetical protein NPA09_00845 [Mycoplasmopsis equigenitalium]VEU69586.1 Uncharacterised protein [Mycoplasmopsis californica]